MKNMKYLILLLCLLVVSSSPQLLAQENEGDNEDLYFSLKESFKLNFHVRENMTQKPLDSAVCLTHEGNRLVNKQYTNQKGLAKVPIWTDRKVKFRFEKEGYVPQTYDFSVQDLIENEKEIDLTVELIGENWIKFYGNFLDVETGHYLSNTKVKIINSTTGDEYITETNDIGNYSFYVDPKYSYEVVSMHPDYLDQRTSINCNCEGGEIPRMCLKGFALVSDGIDPQTSRSVLSTTTESEKVRINKTYKVENIYYDYDKWFIRQDAALILDDLNVLLKDNPNIKVELGSHTDSRGSDSYNEVLSQRRAESAVQYLIENGLKDDRIVAKGYGETVIINRCINGVRCPDIEHEQNRRTEFKILGFMEMEEELSN